MAFQQPLVLFELIHIQQQPCTPHLKCKKLLYKKCTNPFLMCFCTNSRSLGMTIKRHTIKRYLAILVNQSYDQQHLDWWQWKGIQDSHGCTKLHTCKSNIWYSDLPFGKQIEAQWRSNIMKPQVSLSMFKKKGERFHYVNFEARRGENHILCCEQAMKTILIK